MRISGYLACVFQGKMVLEPGLKCVLILESTTVEFIQNLN